MTMMKLNVKLSKRAVEFFRILDVPFMYGKDGIWIDRKLVYAYRSMRAIKIVDGTILAVHSMVDNPKNTYYE